MSVRELLRRDPHRAWVVGLSVALSLYCAMYVAFAPPTDGDAFEYAGLARNFLRYGEMKQTHVAGYFFANQLTIPHPAFNRATLWTVLMLPFQWLLGTTIWVFILPALASLVFFNLAAYGLGRAVFSREVAFFGALATLLNPRVLAGGTTADPGLPDFFGAALFVLTLTLFLRERWLGAGIAQGIAIVTRLNALLLPVILLGWLLLFRRSALRTRGPWIYVTAAFLACSPLLTRNVMLYGNPFYLDEYASPRSSGADSIEIVKTSDIWRAWLEYQPYQPSVEMGTEVSVGERLQFIRYNSLPYLFGHHTGLSYYPGIFEILTLVLVPFFILGAWVGRRDPKKLLLVGFVVAHLSALMLLKGGYEDRYLLPILPVCTLLAFDGAAWLGRGRAWLTPRRLLFVFILIEAAPALAWSVLPMIGGADKRERASELSEVCAWVRDKTPKEAVFMTVPFWSPQYLCDRPTVPPSVGDMRVFKTIADEYDVRYFMFWDYWGGDRLPRMGFLEPVLRGKYLSLYRVDHDHPDYAALDDPDWYLGELGVLDYFWRGRLNFQEDLPTFKIFTKSFGVIPGALAFVALCGAILWLLSRDRRRPVAIVYPILLVGLLILRGGVMLPLMDVLMLTPPPVSRFQLSHYFEADPRTTTVSAVNVAGDRRDPAIRAVADAIQEASGRLAVPIPGADLRPQRADSAIFVPVPEVSTYLADAAAVRTSIASTAEENRESLATVARLRELAYRAVPMAGGALGVPVRRNDAAPDPGDGLGAALPAKDGP